jgi:hypothetical protein
MAASSASKAPAAVAVVRTIPAAPAAAAAFTSASKPAAGAARVLEPGKFVPAASAGQTPVLAALAAAAADAPPPSPFAASHPPLPRQSVWQQQQQLQQVGDAGGPPWCMPCLLQMSAAPAGLRAATRPCRMLLTLLRWRCLLSLPCSHTVEPRLCLPASMCRGAAVPDGGQRQVAVHAQAHNKQDAEAGAQAASGQRPAQVAAIAWLAPAGILWFSTVQS